MDKITKIYPFREDLIQKLAKLYPNSNHELPKFVYVLGTDEQMSEILKMCFSTLDNTKSVILDATQCYSNKILFDIVLNGLNESKEPQTRADDMMDFLDQLSELDRHKSFVIAIENAQKLRDLEFNILPVFVKLREFTNLNISCIFISCIPLEKMHPKLALTNAIKIQVPALTKNDLVSLFLSEYPAFKEKIHAKVIKKDSKLVKEEDKAEKLEVLKSLDENFYLNYLNIFFGMFYKVCRDPKELRFMCKKCYHLYYAPILSGEIKRDDVNALWKNISNPMQECLNHLYSRINTQTKLNQTSIEPVANSAFQSKYSHVIELPFYTKYLLIASFLASHNDPKSDKRLFMKHHGKQRKKAHDVQKQAKVSEKMAVQLGPKSFTVDRLLAIFYAILDEKIGLTCNLLTQISTLIELNFITFVSGENNILDGTSRLQCTVGMDFAANIGANVGFNVKKYIIDFY